MSNVTLLDLATWPLAVLALLRTWFLGSIFAERLARVEVGKSRLAKMLSCPLCFSWYLSVFPAGALLIMIELNLYPTVFRFILYTLACINVVQVLWRIEFVKTGNRADE